MVYKSVGGMWLSFVMPDSGATGPKLFTKPVKYIKTYIRLSTHAFFILKKAPV